MKQSEKMAQAAQPAQPANEGSRAKNARPWAAEIAGGGVWEADKISGTLNVGRPPAGDCRGSA